MMRAECRCGAAALFSVLLLAACRDQPANSPDDGANWRRADVVVTQYSAAEPRRLMLWVRVVNESTAVRGICTRSIAYAVNHDDYQNVGTSGDRRACADAGAFSLVAPGESAYAAIPIAREDLQLPEAELTLKLLLADAAFPALHPSQDVALEWRLAIGAITAGP